MRLTPAVYSHLCHSLMALANGKIAVVLEGGYCISSLSESAALTLRTLLGYPCPLIGPVLPYHDSLISSVLDVVWALRPYWKSLKMQGDFERHKDEEEEEGNVIRKHYPVLEYKGTLALIAKPERYLTRDCYPVQNEEIKIALENEIAQLIKITGLSVPKLFESQRTAIVFDEQLTKHKCPERGHPERPSRVQAIFKQLQKDKLFQRCYRVPSKKIADEDLLLAHKKEYVETLEQTKSKTQKELNKIASKYDSIYITKETYECAKLAAGSLICGVDEVLQNNCLNGFACIRPPGHHASQNQASGFCIFNNVALAAKYALKNYNLSRILIVDWDVHHGDGIQKIVEDDERILYVSLHRYDSASFFPGNIESNFNRGKNIINIPFNNEEMSDADYMTAFFSIVMPVAYQFDPQLVLVSCGFDAAEGRRNRFLF